MSRTIELSDETHQHLVEMARQQNQTPEDVIRQIVIDYESERFRRANGQMLAEGVLASLPVHPVEITDDFAPQAVPGKPLSEIILEERR